MMTQEFVDSVECTMSRGESRLEPKHASEIEDKEVVGLDFPKPRPVSDKSLDLKYLKLGYW